MGENYYETQNQNQIVLHNSRCWSITAWVLFSGGDSAQPVEAANSDRSFETEAKTNTDSEAINATRHGTRAATTEIIFWEILRCPKHADGRDV